MMSFSPAPLCKISQIRIISINDASSNVLVIESCHLKSEFLHLDNRIKNGKISEGKFRIAMRLENEHFLAILRSK